MVFLDSNVLVYIAIDQDPAKKERALKFVSGLVASGEAVISLQVLREVANCMFRKSGSDVDFIKETISGFKSIPCVIDTPEMMERGMEIKARYGIQFYDALVVAAAEAAGCDTVFSENMADGAEYGSVRVENPFRRK